MTTFALVHGAYHSGAHWSRLVPELRARGFDAVAPDLPSPDPNAGAAEYAKTADAALAGAADVIVVGHSMGGLTAPVVATMRPVRAIVYLCALLPLPGNSFDDYASAEPAMRSAYPAQTQPHAHEDGSATSHPAHATEVWYHDCGWQAARWAIGLLRPQQWKVTQERTPLGEMPHVPAHVIVAGSDRAIDPEWARRAARERLGVGAVEIEGGHSPHIARPGVLAAILERLATA